MIEKAVAVCMGFSVLFFALAMTGCVFQMVLNAFQK